MDGWDQLDGNFYLCMCMDGCGGRRLWCAILREISVCCVKICAGEEALEDDHSGVV